MKVLWIDDDGDLLDVQINQLADEGIDVTVAQDVDTAWKHLVELKEPTLVILDIMMGTGSLLKNQNTNGGISTGERFLEKMEDAGMLQLHRVMVYTIMDSASINDLTQRLNVPYYLKTDHSGKAIVKLVKDLQAG